MNTETQFLESEHQVLPPVEPMVDSTEYESFNERTDAVYAFAQRFWAFVDEKWCDHVFAVGGLTFFVSLIPILLNPGAAVPYESSIPTAVGLTMFLFVYHHLRLRFSLVTGTLSALAWFAIVLLRGF